MWLFMGLKELVTYFLQQNGEVDEKGLAKEHFSAFSFGIYENISIVLQTLGNFTAMRFNI